MMLKALPIYMGNSKLLEGEFTKLSIVDQKKGLLI